MNKLMKTLKVVGPTASMFLVTAKTAFATEAIGTIDKGTGYADNIGSLITSVLSIVLVIALIMVLMYLVWGGISWITAGGDKGKTEEARNKITAAVIGIVILAAAWALVQFVAYVLGFEDLQNALNSVERISTQ